MKQLELFLDEARDELRRALGEDLLCLAVYGSAAGPDYHPGTSDINLVLVLKQVDLAALDKVRQCRERWRAYRVAAPLVTSEKMLRSSRDVFPIEYLEIKEQHRLLAGKDVFDKLAVSRKNLRHECEHELRGRQIRLRQSYLENGSEVRALKALLGAAHNANFPAFRAVLRLKKVVPPVGKEAVEEALGRHFKIKIEVLQRVRQMRLTAALPAPEVLRRLLEDYLAEVEKIVAWVDGL